MAKNWLNIREPENNTILTIAGQAESANTLLRPPFWFGLAETKNDFQGAAVHALPDGLVLSGMEEKYVAPLVRSMLQEGITPHRIYAPTNIAAIAAHEIGEYSGNSFVARRCWQTYVTRKIIDADFKTLGRLRKATSADATIVSTFGKAYEVEKPAIVDVVQYLKSKLPSGDLYLWVDNDAQKIRSIVATAGKTDAVIRIALVFTSKKFRGNGYASAAVATVTNANLRSGLESVTLTVESGDFESIRMYKSLGYVYLSECIELISQE